MTKPHPAGKNNGAEGDSETEKVNKSHSKDLRDRLLNRKSEINAADENPVYQKSIDELGNTDESDAGEVSRLRSN